MSDPQKETYLRLMGEVQSLEERVEDLEKDLAVMAESGNPRDVEIQREELRTLRERLAEARRELARVSDGCGHARHEKDPTWKASCTEGRTPE